MLMMFTQSFKDSGFSLGNVSGGEVIILLEDCDFGYALDQFKQKAIEAKADFVFNLKIQYVVDKWLITGDLYRKAE